MERWSVLAISMGGTVVADSLRRGEISGHRMVCLFVDYRQTPDDSDTNHVRGRKKTGPHSNDGLGRAGCTADGDLHCFFFAVDGD